MQARLAERQALLDRVRRLLVEQLHLRREPDEIDPDCSLFGTGLGLDSVDAVELVVALETEFGVILPDGPPSRRALRTVNTLIDVVLAHAK
jgi:acyl carrier protein